MTDTNDQLYEAFCLGNPSWNPSIEDAARHLHGLLQGAMHGEDDDPIRIMANEETVDRLTVALEQLRRALEARDAA